MTVLDEQQTLLDARSAAVARLRRDDAAQARARGKRPTDQEAWTPDDAPELAIAPFHSPVLSVAAEFLNDLESLRIAAQNRYRSLISTDPDSDGVMRGMGLPFNHPSVRSIAELVERFGEMEKAAEKQLKREMGAHPLAPYIKSTPGLGEKSTARLLAAIGDPYWNSLHQRPRLVSELWSFSGFGVNEVTTDGPQGAPLTGGVAPSRQRGQRANWSPTAKMRTFLIAEVCMKGLRQPCERPDGLDWAIHVGRDGLAWNDAGGACTCYPYRRLYDEARIKYFEAVHTIPCKRCGPSGKPAQPGSPLSAKHKQGRALRITCKRILRDLWAESRRLHGVPDEAPY